MAQGCCNTFLSCICAYLLPPLGVYWRFGCGTYFWVCLLLTFCGYVPGIIFAACMIGCETPERLQGQGHQLRTHP